MKHLFVIAQLLFTCMIVRSAKAESELDLALKAGPNAATLAANNRFNRYGFSGGLSGHLQRPIANRFLLGGQMELLYTPRGAEAKVDGQLIGKSREHYLDIVLAARPAARLGPASVYLLLGGGLNFLVSANQENAAGAKQDITGDLHRIDVALLGGAGVAVHLPHQEFGPFRLGTAFLEARHDIGLMDTDALNGGFKNRTSSLMLGLSFVLGTQSPPSTRISPLSR